VSLTRGFEYYSQQSVLSDPVKKVLSVRKVVPTLTIESTEIYLSMAGAKQLMTQGISWFQPGPYVQQWCARGTILRRTVVLAEGSNKQGGRGGRTSRSLRCD
jgi:hypothetical protein